MSHNQTSWGCYGLEASISFTIATVVFFIQSLRSLAAATNCAAKAISARCTSARTAAAAHS
jgi:hypothetical protein